MDGANPAFSSELGVLYNAHKTLLIQYPEGGQVGGFAIPNGVTRVGDNAFSDSGNLKSIVIPDGVTRMGQFTSAGCTNLASVTIPVGLTNLGSYTFLGCGSLTSLYSDGDAPSLGSAVFLSADAAIVCYLPGAVGWSGTYGGRPTAVWRPRTVTDDGMFGLRADEFGFNISWAKVFIVEVEACPDLSVAEPVWTVVRTVPLTDGGGAFSDPDWGSFPDRFYRLRMKE